MFLNYLYYMSLVFTALSQKIFRTLISSIINSLPPYYIKLKKCMRNRGQKYFNISILHLSCRMSDLQLKHEKIFSMRIDIPEIESEDSFHSVVNVSKTNCKIMESFNIYKNTQLKKANMQISISKKF